VNKLDVFFTVGEECVFDMDCQSDGGHCDGNICVSTAEGNKHTLANISELNEHVYITLTSLIAPNMCYISSINSLTTNLNIILIKMQHNF
jgi:hypothetical protein